MIDDKRSNHSKGSNKKRLKRAGSNDATTTFLPRSIVCSASAAMERPGAVEAGVILCLLVLVIYLLGFFETVLSLPDATKIPPFSAHLGENFNLAHPSEWDHPSIKKVAEGVVGKEPPPPPPGHDLLRRPADANAQNAPNPGRVNELNQLAANVAQQQQQQQQQPQQQRDAPKQDAFSVRSPGKAPKIPAAKWPVSIRDELDDFETLVHPGDEETIMSVPKFWSYPIHNNQLMPRELALQIGSCIEPDEHGNFNRGTDCPVENRTIYVGIASYRDFECRSTAESIFLRAKYPERIRIGVVDQIVDGEDAVCNAPILPCDQAPEQGLCRFKNQIDVYEMEAQLSIGPVFARHIGYRLYRGEYYATQSDAHVTYTQDWDADIIEQFEQSRNEMAVLSTYLTDVQGSIDENGHSLRNTRPIMCNTRYEGGPQGMHLRHGSQPERVPSVQGTPQLQPWWAAGYSFSRGHFVVNVPYDWLQPMIFQGEEMSIGIRGFTIGYDFYAPERSVCFHHYAVGKNAQIRNKVHHFWENTKYAGLGRRAMNRLLGLVHMNPEIDAVEWDHTDADMYGIGGVRTPEKFYEIFGIDVAKKTVEGHLCTFVDEGGRMHKEFTPYLRPDGMGIDYNRIHFQFKDPRPENE